MKPLWILLSNFFAKTAFAAACCGGGLSMPALVAGDSKAQFSSSLSQSVVSADVLSNGLWKKREEKEIAETVRFDAAHVFSDRYQMGLSVPLIRRSKFEESSSGLSDTSLTVGYEFLPDWDYNPYRPKGIGYFQIILPTGRSVYDTDDRYGLDSRGRGFWAIGMGALFTKNVLQYDGFVSFSMQKSFSRTTTIEGEKVKLIPGVDGNFSIGFGYNTRGWRWGSDVTWVYQDAVKIMGGYSEGGEPQRYATVSLSGNYSIDEKWTVATIYSDQTWIGSPINTSLSQSLMLQLQKRWQR